jgi:hypothetical protein
MLRVLFDFVVDTHLAPAFATPTLRKKREGWGTPYVGDACEIKSQGHPPIAFNVSGEAKGFPVKSGGA